MPAQPELIPVEKDKLELGFDFDFREIAGRPWDQLPARVIAMFKWTGVYHQLQGQFFMIRVVTPGGRMTTRQFRRALELAELYGQGQLCITTRQTLQYHWVRKEDLCKILEGMAEVGITTRNGCGDVTRNVVTCSLQGVCPHEVGDAVRPLIEAIAADPEIQLQQRNLPRKHKISVAGCGRACAQTLMNCQGWVPVARTVRRDGADLVETGWKFHAGGGLGARPYLAKVIFDWVPQTLALPVTQAVIEAYCRHGNRRNRALSRLKVVVDTMGARAFGETVLGILRERGVAGLDQIELAASPVPDIGPMFLDGQAVIPQRQPGLHTVRVMIRRSELSVPEGRQLAGLADQFGGGEVMFTNRQNLEIRHVPAAQVEPLRHALHAAGFRTDGHERLPDIVACVGTTQCRMAVSDTPKAYHLLLEQLAGDRPLWEAVGPLRINLTGCPNNCAHGWVADIGLRGRRTRDDAGASTEGFTVLVGGSLAGAGSLATPILEVSQHTTPAAIRSLLQTYLAHRRAPEETFAAFVRRVTPEGLRALLPEIAP